MATKHHAELIGTGHDTPPLGNQTFSEIHTNHQGSCERYCSLDEQGMCNLLGIKFRSTKCLEYRKTGSAKKKKA